MAAPCASKGCFELFLLGHGTPKVQIGMRVNETLGLMPATPALRAMTMKTVNDANDVLDEITLDRGRQISCLSDRRAKVNPRGDKIRHDVTDAARGA